MEETLSCGKKPTWKWKKPCRNTTDNPKYRLSPKKASWKETQPTRHDFCSPLTGEAEYRAEVPWWNPRVEMTNLWLEWFKNYCIFHMLRPCIGVTHNPNYPFIRPLIGVTYLPGGGNSRSFFISTPIFWGNDPIWLSHILQMGGSTSNWRSTIKRSVTTPLKVTTKKCEASCRFWKSLKLISGLSFCDLFYPYVWNFVSPLQCFTKKSSIPQHQQFPILLRVRKSLGGKRWSFIFEGFWTKDRFYPRNLTDEQDWISPTRWAPTIKKLIYNPYK